MRPAPLLLLLVIPAAAVAACADSTNDNASVEQSTDQNLTFLELKCLSGSTTFDIEPAFGGAALEGKLAISSSENTLFVCRPPASDAGASDLVVSCDERPQNIHPGQWKVDVTKTGADYKATIKKGDDAGVDVTMSCATPSRPDAGEGGAAVPTYADVKSLIDGKCGGCHNGAFDTLAKVKSSRSLMVEMISSGSMPRFQPNWKDSASGQKVLDFLRNSPELQ